MGCLGKNGQEGLLKKMIFGWGPSGVGPCQDVGSEWSRQMIMQSPLSLVCVEGRDPVENGKSTEDFQPGNN
jgi:hypothetical protein